MSTASLAMNSSDPMLEELFKPSPQDKKFVRILIILLALYLLFGVAVPFFEQVNIPREIKEQVPPHLAQVLIKEKQLPLPEKIKEPPKVEPEKSEEKPKDKPKEPPKPVVNRDTAKKIANTSGLATMKDELFAMREAFDIKPAASQTLKKADISQAKVKRKLLASAAKKQSDGIKKTTVNRVVSSDALSTKNTEHITLSETETVAMAAENSADEESSNNANQRAEMSIRQTLEANKSRLYTLYNRALRKDPFLKGKVQFTIEIQPNGNISKVNITQSQLNNPKLERQLLLVLRRIKFSAEDVAVITTVWSIDFLPS